MRAFRDIFLDPAQPSFSGTDAGPPGVDLAMNMTDRGIGCTFGTVTSGGLAQAEPTTGPTSLRAASTASSVAHEVAEHTVGGLPADYSALTEAEWNQADDEHDAILARSVAVSRTAGV